MAPRVAEELEKTSDVVAAKEAAVHEVLKRSCSYLTVWIVLNLIIVK